MGLMRMFLENLAFRLPGILVCVAGIIVAIIKWRSAKAAAILVLFACLTTILLSLVMAGAYPCVQYFREASSAPYENIRSIMLMIRGLDALIGIVPPVLLLVAAFIGRKKTPLE